ncbi:MAG: hypothetical protein JXR76_19985 [Deltaproteobacteria bacterium]|nr:hypothetical protein [Deltaproteobacteria bacterium]
MKRILKYLLCTQILAFVPAGVTAGVFDEAVSGGDVSTTSDSASFEDTATSESDAESDVGDDSPVVVASPLQFDFNGYVRGDVFAGKMPGYSQTELKNGYGELALKLRVSKGSYGDAFGEVRFKGGYLNDGHYLGQPSDVDAYGQPTQVDSASEDAGEMGASVQLREAYVNAYFGRLEVRLGHQIVLWGRADGINPTNNITPIDIRVRSPEEDERRLANTGLRIKLDLSPLRIEGIWMPFYAPSVVPQIILGDALRFAEPDYPDLDLTNGLFAGKIHLIFPAIEMSVSYLNGYSLTPGIRYVKNNFSAEYYDEVYDSILNRTKTVSLNRTAFRHQVIGFDFSTTLGSFMGLRGEVAFRYPEKQNEETLKRLHIPNPELHYVLGVDKEFGNLMVVAQYIGRYVLNWKDLPKARDFQDDDIEDRIDALNAKPEFENLEETVDFNIHEELVNYVANRELVKINHMIHNQNYEIQHGVSLRLSYSALHDTLTLVAFGMLNFTTQEYVFYPKIQYKLTDAMELSLGAELYFGPEESLFGMIDETMSAGYTELKISF